jgi:hypothetical protein
MGFAYSTVLARPFHSDEAALLVEDEALHRFATLTDSSAAAFSLPVKAYVAVCWKIGGGEAWPYRLGGLLIHVGSVLMLLRLISLLSTNPHATIGGLAVGILSAVHPGLTEGINSVFGLPVLMGVFLLLLSLNVFFRCLKQEKLNVSVLVCGLTAYAIGFYVQPLILVGPCLVLLCVAAVKDYRKSFYPIVCGALIGVTFLCVVQQWSVRSIQESSLTGAIIQLPNNGFYVEGLKLLFSPVWVFFSDYSLSTIYQSYEGDIFPWIGVAGFIIGITLTRWNRMAGLGCLWLALYPFFSGMFLSSDAFSESLGYGLIPGGLLVVVGVLDSFHLKRLEIGLGSVLMVVSILSAFETNDRNGEWQNEIHLLEAVSGPGLIDETRIARLGAANLAKAEELIEREGGNEIPEDALPFLLDAESWYMLTLNFRPTPSDYLFDLAKVQRLLGKKEDSFKRTSQGLQQVPEHSEGLRDYYRVSASMGETHSTLALMDSGQKAVELGLLRPAERTELAKTFQKAGLHRDAVYHLGEAATDDAVRVKDRVEMILNQQMKLSFGNSTMEREERLFQQVLGAYVDGNYLSAGYRLNVYTQNRSYQLGEWVVAGLLANRHDKLERFINDETKYVAQAERSEQWLALSSMLVLEREMDAVMAVLEVGEVPGRRFWAGEKALEYGFISEAIGQFEALMAEFPDGYEAWLGMADVALVSNKGSANLEEVVAEFLNNALVKGAPEEEIQDRRAQLDRLL